MTMHTNSWVRAVHRGVVLLPFEFETDGAGAVVAGSIKGKGIASVTHNAGEYTITLDGHYFALFWGGVALEKTAAHDIVPQPKSRSVANKQLVLRTYDISSAAAAAFPSGKVNGMIVAVRTGANV